MKNTPINKAFTYIRQAALLALAVAFLGSATPVLADAPIYASCVATPFNASVGDNVNWQVQNPTGGNGSYLYSWGGSDSLYGSGQTVYKTYTYPGTKSATVTITSGNQTFTTTCSTNVVASNGYYYNNGYNNNYPYGSNGTLTASCYASPSVPNLNDNVSWYGSATGGSGNYIYSWSGTDGLYGNGATVYRTYNTLGMKTAVLTVTSNGMTATQTCSVNVGNSYNGNYYNGYNNGNYNGGTCGVGGYYSNGIYYSNPPCNNNNNYPYNTNTCSAGGTSYYSGGVYYCNYNNGYNNNTYGGGFINTGYNGYNNGYNNGSTYYNPPINGSSQTTYAYPTTSYSNTYSSGNAGTPVAGVFLSQVPSTGISFSLKMALFIIGLFAWSLFAAFLIQRKRKTLAVASHGSIDQYSKIEAFKQRNIQKKSSLK